MDKPECPEESNQAGSVVKTVPWNENHCIFSTQNLTLSNKKFPQIKYLCEKL